jgi:hypothetical protein
MPWIQYYGHIGAVDGHFEQRQFRYVENTPPLESDFIKFKALVCSALGYNDVAFMLGRELIEIKSAVNMFDLYRQNPTPILHAVQIFPFMNKKAAADEKVGSRLPAYEKTNQPPPSYEEAIRS